jgi:hypothetical protein
MPAPRPPPTAAPNAAPETGTKNGAADSLGIDLVAQRSDLRVGKLAARLIIIIRLCYRAGAHRERRQSRTDEPCNE